jgi:hypothetical protein
MKLALHSVGPVVDDARIRLFWSCWDVHPSYSLFTASPGVNR